MDLLFIGLAFGAIIAYFIFIRFSRGRKREKTNAQSVILMEKIRSVCKFITVEGDFSEIYHYENVKDKWFNLILGKKKALILIEAKAHIETDFKYYDKKEGWANPFTATDLTEINKEAKQHIVDKIPSSGLLEEASKQALETIHLMEKLVETINWKLDYSELQIKEYETKAISDKK